MVDTVVFSVKYLDARDEETNPEIFQLPNNTLWIDLEAMLKAQFECEDIRVTYLDRDGDEISLSSQEELREALKVAEQTSNVLDITIRNTGPDCIDLFNSRGSSAATAPPTPVIKIDKAPAVPAVQIVPAVPNVEEVSEAPPVPPRRISRSMTEFTKKMKHEKLRRVAKDVCITVEPDTQKKKRIVVSTKDGAEPDPTAESEETGELPPDDMTRDAETGTVMKRSKSKKGIKRKDPYMQIAREYGEVRRLTQSVDRSPRRKQRTCDSESGEVSTDDSQMSYNKFVDFMEKMKQDLHSEIVKDVTKKTVRQVLKGLDGAVIQPATGSGQSSISSSEGISYAECPNAISHVHPGVKCDSCGRDIVGIRYKCGNCVDFDLCDLCEVMHGVHDPDHVFLKLYRPIRALQVRREMPLFKSILYRAPMKEEQTELEEIMPMEGSRLERYRDKMARKQEKLKKKEERLADKQRRKEDKLRRQLEEPAHKREKLDLPQLRRPLHAWSLGAQFVCDVTIPDLTCVQPATKLLKIWKMKNTGGAQWTEKTQLRLMWGNIPVPVTEVSVPLLAPGEEGDISAELVAPEEPGKYQSHWKMFDMGVQFGHRVWCSIIVQPKEVLEPTHPEPLKMVKVEEDDKPQQLDEEEGEQKVEEPLRTVVEEPEDEQVEPLVTEDLQLDVEPKEEEEEEEEEFETSEIKEISVNKVEQDLTTAAEAVAQLRCDQEPDTAETGQVLNTAAAAVAQLQLEQEPILEDTVQDLLSFEMLHIRERSPPKVSQTATPTNTPLDVTPPKSPAPEPYFQAQMSNSSSVELVGEEQIDDDLQHMTDYVQERMASLGLKPEVEVDVESLSSFSEDDDDDSSMSDSDFFIVPLPDCFDTTKPLTRSMMESLSDNEEGEFDSNHNTITSGGSREFSVDEILRTSSTELSAAPINPTVTSEPTNQDAAVQAAVVDTPQFAEAATVTEMIPLVPATLCMDIPDAVGVTSLERIPMPGAAAAAGDEEANIHNSETGEPSGGEAEQQVEATFEETEAKEPLSSTAATSQPQDIVIPREKQQADENSPPSSPSDYANQMFSTAVEAAQNAAAKAYTTAKEVFYTWQARQSKGEGKAPKASWKPPTSQWKPTQTAWTPQTEQWKPPADNWTPPKDNWMPPPTDWKHPKPEIKPEEKLTSPDEGWVPPEAPGPMAKLIEMGFANRKLNQELLDKYNNDLEPVLQDLLFNLEHDWHQNRH